MYSYSHFNLEWACCCWVDPVFLLYCIDWRLEWQNFWIFLPQNCSISFWKICNFYSDLPRVRNLLHLLQSCTSGSFHMLFLVILSFCCFSVVIYNGISDRFEIILSSLHSWLWIMFISPLSIGCDKQMKHVCFPAARQNLQELYHSLNELSGEREQKSVTILSSPAWLLLHPRTVEAWFPWQLPLLFLLMCCGPKNSGDTNLI